MIVTEARPGRGEGSHAEPLPHAELLPGAGLAALSALAIVAAAALLRQAAAPHATYIAGLAVDRLGAALCLLVGVVGAVTYRFSMRYLAGHPGRWRFLAWLSATVCAAALLMLADNLPMLWAAWFFTSLGLHRLLTSYADRPEALPPARKKFLISRLGDVALVAAIVLIALRWHTSSLHVFLPQATASGDAAAGAVAVLVALAALTKSAQFPFHSWLPETMEAPTPVSALMHAGVINAGGVLLLRFAPLVGASPAALALLTLVGTLTACLGMLATWAQVKVKRTLARSTVAQMGFMMVQCGLGVFPAAALHMVGHGLYKASKFLRAGDLPSPAPTPPAPRASATTNLALLALGAVAATAALAFASICTGFDPRHAPGELALTAILALALAQIWVALLSGSSGSRTARGLLALALTFAAAVGAFALYRGASAFLEPVIGHNIAWRGYWAWAVAAVPVLAFAAMAVLHACLPALAAKPSGRALYVHALLGFYFGTLADRCVARIWPTTPYPKELIHA